MNATLLLCLIEQVYDSFKELDNEDEFFLILEIVHFLQHYHNRYML